MRKVELRLDLDNSVHRTIERCQPVSLNHRVGDGKPTNTTCHDFRALRELMAYLGLVSSEHSMGDSVKRGAITKTGNSRARRTLVESAWGYRHPAP
jgi:Transposase IS116/IS110/IS902 family